MNSSVITLNRPANDLSLGDPHWVRWLMIAGTLVIITLLLILPLVAVLIQAFAKGWSAYADSLTHPDTLAAMRLTLITASVTVPLTTVFGVSAAWAIARFEFKGKSFLIGE